MDATSTRIFTSECPTRGSGSFFTNCRPSSVRLSLLSACIPSPEYSATRHNPAADAPCRDTHLVSDNLRSRATQPVHNRRALALIVNPHHHQHLGSPVLQLTKRGIDGMCVVFGGISQLD